MKLKILTLLSVFAVVLGARAEARLFNIIDFEANGLQVGESLNVEADDTGAPYTPYRWCSNYRVQTGTFCAYATQGEKYPYTEGEKLVPDGNNTKYLLADSSLFSLYRSAMPNGGFPPDPLTDDERSVAIEDGIIIDTLMQFEPIEGLDIPEVEAPRAKLFVWQGTDGKATDATTNLYVTAGSINKSSLAVSPANFTLALAEGEKLVLNPAEWHRLTVRAIDSITTDESQIAAFILFLDGKPLICEDDNYTSAFGGGVATKLKPTAKEFFDEKRLFLSMIPDGAADAQRIMTAGFSGLGKVDDLSIVDYASGPAFAQGGMWTLKWTEGVTGFKLNGEAVSIEGGAKEIAFTGASDTAKITEVTYNAAGYEAGTWTTEGGATLEDNTFTITAANAVCTIVVKPKAATRFTVGGKSYSLLSEVFADDLGSDPITIELADDFSTELEIGMEEGYLIGGDMPAITLDLKGHTITKEGISGVLFTINAECKGFTLIDTARGGKLVGDAEGLFNISGAVTIGNLEADQGVTIETVLTDKFGASEALLIVNGRFKDPENTTSGAFSYADNLADDRSVEIQSGYWTTIEYIPPSSVNFTATFGEGIESATMNGSPLTTDPVEVEFETTYTIEPTLAPWYIDAAISESDGITPDGLSFIVNAGVETASATISATNAKDSPRSASELAELLGITDNPEAIANDTRFKAIATWAQGKGYLPAKLNDAGFNREYLLNGFTGELKITSIAVDSTTGVITIGKPEWDFNGGLHVQGKAQLTDRWTDCAEPIKTENGYNFFRLELRFE